MSFEFAQIQDLEVTSIVGQQPLTTVVPTTKAASGTMTAAQLAGGLIVNTTATSVTLTTDTGLNLYNQFHPQVGQAFKCYVANTTGATVTVTGGTGVTVVGASGSIATSFEMTFIWNGIISTVYTWHCYF
jgi:hypothetical protein